MSSRSNNNDNNNPEIPNYLNAVDEVEIQFLVDNNLDDLSTIPSPLQDNTEVQNGTAWQIKTGAMKTTFAGECLCCAQHGFSVLITVRKFRSSSSSSSSTATKEEQQQQLVFDAGPWGPTFVDNCRKLNRDLTNISGIALSHGHFDHAGGILDALRETRRQKEKFEEEEEVNVDGSVVKGIKEKIMSPKTPTYMNNDQVVKRAIQVPFSPEPMPLGPVPTPDEIDDAGGTYIDTGKDEYLIPYEKELFSKSSDCDDEDNTNQNNKQSFFYISGEIPRVTSYEKGLNYHYTYDTNTNKWEFDRMVMDERFLAVYLKNRGLIVFSSCSHAGIVNVVKHATEKFKNITNSEELDKCADAATVPVYAVVGGLHLSGRDKDPIIDDTVADLSHVPYIVPGHCTGFRAVHALLNRYGDKRVIPAATGKLITWTSS